MAAGELGVPTRMSGAIVGRNEDGDYVADMAYPERLRGVVLPADAEFVTKPHQYEGARV